MGLGFLLEGRGHHLQRQLRGHFALGVPAHAVGQQEQRGVARVAVAHAVFIGGASAATADLEYGETHGEKSSGAYFLPETAPCTLFLASDTMVSSCRRIFSVMVSLV